MIIYTQGLIGENNLDKTYEFNIENNILSIPSHPVSRDEYAPDFYEQEVWIKGLDAIKLKPVYYATWEFENAEDIDTFIKLLKPITIKTEI